MSTWVQDVLPGMPDPPRLWVQDVLPLDWPERPASLVPRRPATVRRLELWRRLVVWLRRQPRQSRPGAGRSRRGSNRTARTPGHFAGVGHHTRRSRATVNLPETSLRSIMTIMSETLPAIVPPEPPPVSRMLSIRVKTDLLDAAKARAKDDGLDLTYVITHYLREYAGV